MEINKLFNNMTIGVPPKATKHLDLQKAIITHLFNIDFNAS